MVMLLSNIVVLLASAIITQAHPDHKTLRPLIVVLPEYEIYPDSEYVEYDDYAEYPNQELDLLPLVPLRGPEPDSNIHLPLETLPYGPQLNAEVKECIKIGYNTYSG